MLEFVETRNLFVEYLGLNNLSVSYEQWLSIPDDQKAAALYVQFFDEICCAWFKANSINRGDECDGVSTVCQYLEKNVPIILADPKRYTPNYIYRVAYNCLYCICHDIKRDQDRFKLEIGHIMRAEEGDEIDFFDFIPSFDADIYEESVREHFWKTVESLDIQSRAVITRLLGEVQKGLPRVSKNRQSEIIEQLKEVFKPYLSLWY